jgi:hypothetical protein
LEKKQTQFCCTKAISFFKIYQHVQEIYLRAIKSTYFKSGRISNVTVTSMKRINYSIKISKRNIRKYILDIYILYTM